MELPPLVRTRWRLRFLVSKLIEFYVTYLLKKEKKKKNIYLNDSSNTLERPKWS
jgi:hypothetical protein